jgi:hypothetical protein
MRSVPRSKEEWDSGFTRNSPSEQGLAGTRRASQKNTLRKLATKSRKRCWVLQELDNVLELLLGLIHALHIAEFDGLTATRLKFSSTRATGFE